jgi:hypothetical protein
MRRKTQPQLLTKAKKQRVEDRFFVRMTSFVYRVFDKKYWVYHKDGTKPVKEEPMTMEEFLQAYGANKDYTLVPV